MMYSELPLGVLNCHGFSLVPSPDGPIPASINEPVWLEPYPADLPAPPETNPEVRYTLSESIRLALLASLHLLPPRQRAVLILRDVLGWRLNEVAEALGQTIPSVKSALHHARATLATIPCQKWSELGEEVHCSW
jgi:RNA polymerase sigma-70 factor (ECF subfamily)